MGKDILTPYGYEVTCTENGKKALDILKNKSFDLLLTDVVMPHMTGYELADKTLKLHPDIKIQIMSGYSEDMNLSAESKILHENKLHKPFHSETLIRRIRELLDKDNIIEKNEDIHLNLN